MVWDGPLMAYGGLGDHGRVPRHTFLGGPCWPCRMLRPATDLRVFKPSRLPARTKRDHQKLLTPRTNLPPDCGVFFPPKRGEEFVEPPRL